MGFFKNMFNEAGKKTGSAIGNRLFPKYTDYVRIGELGVDVKSKFFCNNFRKFNIQHISAT